MLSQLVATPLRTISCRFYSASSALSAEKLNVEGLASKVDLSGQNVLMRVDLNVPLDKSDEVTVTDDTRLRAIVPTAKYLLEKNAKLILCSHFGRPKGEIIEKGKNGRLTPTVPHLSELLGTTVVKADDCMGPEVEKMATDMEPGTVLLLENTRFYAEETKNGDSLSAGLGKLADYFVMDAFGTAHRAHSSTAGVTSHMKMSAAGYLLDKELKYLKGAVNSPNRPLCAIVGGAKVSTKIPVISSLIEKCDTVLIGGGMIFTFYKAMGLEVGESLIEDDMVELAGNLMKEAEAKGVKLLLPVDVTCAAKFDADADAKVCGINSIEGMGLDIGPESIKQFGEVIANSQTVVWNGPMGVFEFPKFAIGTFAIADMLAEATEKGATTIIGGGDSVAAVNQAGLGPKMSHISTGGGASLELLEGKVLPGVDALTDA